MSDHSGLGYNKQVLADALESAGYKQNDCVGDPEVKSSQRIFARWLVGQAIDCLREGMSLHPSIQKFANDYRLF